jgi:hypothetical protein
MKMNKKYWILIVILVLLFFPEFDDYSQGYWDDIEQWQFGSLHYMVRDDDNCFIPTGIPQPKQQLLFNSFFTRATVNWNSCEKNDWIEPQDGISFAIKDPFYSGYSIFGVTLQKNYGAVGVLNKWIPTIWLWE